MTGGVALGVLAARQLLEERRLPGIGAVGVVGLCFGVAISLKQVAVLEACMCFAGLMALAILHGRMLMAGVLSRAVAFTAGCSLPMAVTGFAYFLRGDLPLFIQANLVAPLLYVSTDTDIDSLVLLRLSLASVVEICWLLAATAAAAVAAALRYGRRRRLDLHAVVVAAAVLWFVAATLGIVLPGKFYAHYFMLWLPPLCIGAALGLREGVARLAPRHSGAALLAVVAIIASMPVLADLAQLGPARRRSPAPRPVARSGGGHRPHGAAG